MCGIAGILSFDAPPPDPGRIRAMTDALRHRGPDGEGRWQSPDGRLALGHRRLKVLDLSDAGAQPMHRGDRYTVVFNGEIYNYLELRAALEPAGHAFTTGTDTEVLLAAFAEWGEACLDRFDGMFAFALWDAGERTLFCARDRFGEKPFFYRHRPGREFAFASEMKALFAGGIEPRIDDRMLYNFLAWGTSVDPERPAATFFQDVLRLPPAHSLTVGPDGGVTVRRYWRLPESPDPDPPSFEDAAERFRSLFTTSVERRLRADVEVGSSLSGGLDSSAVVLTIDRLRPGARRHTFSARFDDPALDEGRWIGMVNAAATTRPHEVYPDPEGLAEDLDRIFFHQEEPFEGASVLAQWEVMKLAAEHGVTVLLDGQGADEVLGGYHRYVPVLLRELWLSDRRRFREERQAWRRLHPDDEGVRTDLRFRVQARMPGLLRGLGGIRRRIGRPGYLADLAPDFAREHAAGPPPFRVFTSLREAMAFDASEQGLTRLLRYADRSSMAFAREVRLPFLSHELVEFLFTLPSGYMIADGWTKRLLREGCADLLPAELAGRTDKLGFRPPEERWLQSSGFRGLLAESVAGLRERGLVSRPSPAKAWTYLMAARLPAFVRRCGDLSPA